MSLTGRYESEDEIKESQDEVVGLHQGALQGPSAWIEPAIEDALSRGDEGTKNQPFSTKDSQVSISESLAKKTGSISLARQLQRLTGETVDSSAPFQRLQNCESGTEPSGIPLARRLQELVQQAQDAAPSTCLPHPQLKVQELTGQTGDSDACIRARFQNSESSLETRGIPLALRLQELVQHSPVAGPSTLLPQPQLRGNKLDGRQHNHAQKPASSTVRDRSAFDDDIVEQLKESSKLDDLAVPVNSTSLIWEQFEEVLELDAPVETNPASTDLLNPKEALLGFSNVLQNALKELKNERAQFEKLLTSSKSLQGTSIVDIAEKILTYIMTCTANALPVSSNSIMPIEKSSEFSLRPSKETFPQFLASLSVAEVLILGKYLEGQLITCHCEILQSPSEWNDPNHAAGAPVENMDDMTMVEVLFSSKICGDLELEVGRVVRVHPPWQEIHEAGQFGKIILGTFFCEMVE